MSNRARVANIIFEIGGLPALLANTCNADGLRHRSDVYRRNYSIRRERWAHAPILCFSDIAGIPATYIHKFLWNHQIAHTPRETSVEAVPSDEPSYVIDERSLKRNR
jgi:hypothetical protein